MTNNNSRFDLLDTSTERRSRGAIVALLCLSLAIPLAAQSRGGRGRSAPGTGNPKEQLVPWHFMENDSSLGTGALILYWFPASAEEVERSPLRSARALVEASQRCVALEGIPLENVTVAEKLAVLRRPSAVLTDRFGKVIGRVDNPVGLQVAAVEQMVDDQLRARDEAMYRDLTEAKQRANAGENQKAIDLYRHIWDDRCLYPLAGQEAQRGLKALGVVVQEPPPAPPPADPNLQPPSKSRRTPGTKPPAAR